MEELETLSIEQLESLCDTNMLEFFQQFHRHDQNKFRSALIQYIRKPKIPYDGVLQSVAIQGSPIRACEALLAVGQKSAPHAPWQQISQVDLENDIVEAQHWLARESERFTHATGLYLGLDTLNMRAGYGTNVEIGWSTNCDPSDLKLEWLERRLERGSKHLIQGLVQLEERYIQATWQESQEPVPRRGWSGFTHYVVFLGYSGIVLAQSLMRLSLPNTMLVVWGFHDGDLFVLGRVTPIGFVMLADHESKSS